MKNVLLHFFVFFLLFQATNAQVKDIEKIFDDAEFFFDTGEYKEALYLYKLLVDHQPYNANFNFKTGMTYLQIPGRETEAIPYFQQATKNLSLDYDDRDLDETHAPHHTWFYLGNAFRMNNQLEQALESYEIFKNIPNFEKKYNLRIVENEVNACERAKIIKDSPLNLKLIHLDPLINDGSENFRPVVSYKDNAMVFVRSKKFYDAIYYSVKSEGTWSEPINITPQIKSDGDLLPSALSTEGDELLLIKQTDTDNGDIYYSELQNGKWTPAIKMDNNINSFKNENHASFSPDGQSLIFSSDKWGGKGGLDLYICHREKDGQWSKAKNLGNHINTAEDETSAFLTNNGNELVFASKGHFNMGGYDIFYSRKQNNGQWGDIINLGYPLNTTRDNNFYQPVGSRDTGYIALFNRDENNGREDIYRIEILPYTDPVSIEKKLFNDSFTIYIKDTVNNETIKLLYDVENEKFSLKSSSAKKYKVHITSGTDEE